MQKLLEGVWGEAQDTPWEFYIADSLPEGVEVTAVMGIPLIDGQIALTKTRRGWELPGGHREGNESTEACLLRELLEEIGAENPIATKLFGYRRITNPDRKVLNPNGGKYPRIAIVPYFLVQLKDIPAGHRASDCFDSGVFDLQSAEVTQSHDYEIVKAVDARVFDN